MKHIRLTLAALAVATTSADVQAADKWWLEPPTDGYWHTGANWGGAPAGIPTTADSMRPTATTFLLEYRPITAVRSSACGGRQ